MKRNVAVWGLGRAGTEMVKVLGAGSEFELAAAITTSPDKAGKDVGELIGAGPNGVRTTADAEAVLRDPGIDVVLYAGLGSDAEQAAIMGDAVDNGKAFITVSGFIHPPTGIGAEAAAALHERAVRGGGRVLGTGVNPGYLLDALPAAIASLSVPAKRIRARRVTDMRYWGDGAMRDEGGCGQDPDQVVVSEHLSLMSSLALLADHFGGMTSEPAEEHEIRVTRVARSDGRRRVEAGQTVGFNRTARVQAGATEIVLEWVSLFCIDPEEDGEAGVAAEIFLEGASDLSLSITGHALIDSYPATAARAVAAIDPLLSLPPGVYRPDQVPATGRG